MTAPQPFPHDHAAAPGHHPWDLTDNASGPPGGRRAGGLRDMLLTAVPVALAGGVALGLLWLWTAPRVPLVARGDAVLLYNSEGQEAIGADGTFLLFGLSVGAVLGLLVLLLRSRSGPAVVIGLAVGAFLGSLLAWRLGVTFGPSQDVVARAREAGEGVVFDAPLELSAKGALLGLPFGALAVHLLGMAVWGPKEEPDERLGHPPAGG
ncbi:hypothetical protein GCM10009716_30710 [Streptomyces sodiiphilus]|uniref:ABC transporter permease n=1 Tax=Streptomyces sodiiphilus TaxID=226217 RepID=A0ABN2PG51_9ACTN